jgi:hypothetical protein
MQDSAVTSTVRNQIVHTPKVKGAFGFESNDTLATLL